MRSLRIGKWTVAAAAAVLVGAVLAGCGDSGVAARDGRPSVLAAFYPYYFLAERIGGGEVTVSNLTQPGAEPHDLELTPRQVAALGAADLVVYEKGFQPAVDEALARTRPRHVLEVGSVVPQLDLSEQNADESAQGHARSDPHVWLDPVRFGAVATAVGTSLSAADPAHAAAFAARAKELVAELQTLNKEFAEGLKNCTSRVIVTSHAAFGYLAATYGLEQIPISGLAPDAEPSPAHIQAIIEAVRKHRITTIFFERLVNPKAAQMLAKDTGVGTAVLDPVEGLADPAATDYFSVMRSNLGALRKALSCT